MRVIIIKTDCGICEERLKALTDNLEYESYHPTDEKAKETYKMFWDINGHLPKILPIIFFVENGKLANWEIGDEDENIKNAIRKSKELGVWGSK